MNYHHLKSILGFEKNPLEMRSPSGSFHGVIDRQAPYVEPTFEKIDFETERPSVILISAVGATGKTALSNVLSFDTKLPLLDLAKHKPVGDNTLTGLITAAYDIKDISQILQGLADGSFGIVIDGLDEGYSKTSNKAFEAFLDDIAERCRGSSKTSFVLLGRSRTIELCWAHLGDKGVTTGLISISPFSEDKARRYIDAYTDGLKSPHTAEYQKARDFVLTNLKATFATGRDESAVDFLSFIGYPPVLDAVVTLLKTERNFHALFSTFDDKQENVEIGLLLQIASHILQRERDQKIIPNIVLPLVADAPQKDHDDALQNSFLPQEQCLRLVAHCLGEKIHYQAIQDPALNAGYERQLDSFLMEHPFLREARFRNAVFEAVAIGTVVASQNPDHIELLNRYTSSNKSSYHVVYIAEVLARGKVIPVRNIRALVTAAMEFSSAHSFVDITIDGGQSTSKAERLVLQIDVLIAGQEREQSFLFDSVVDSSTEISIGPELGSVSVSVPCSVILEGHADIELVAPVDIEARDIRLSGKSLVLRPGRRNEPQAEIVFMTDSVTSTLERISANGVQFSIALGNTKGVTYPLVQYVKKRPPIPDDTGLVDKYFRLKRILMEFRSHSKGALARYRDKIEADHVLKNALGRQVLDRLVHDGILSLRQDFYYLNPDAQSRHIGVSWQDLRRGETPDTLLAYLRSI